MNRAVHTYSISMNKTLVATIVVICTIRFFDTALMNHVRSSSSGVDVQGLTFQRHSMSKAANERARDVCSPPASLLFKAHGRKLIKW